MPSKFARHCWLFLWLATISTGLADVAVVKESPATNHIVPTMMVVSANWRSHLPPSARVNAPEFLTVLFPGQKIAVALAAQGPDRDALLKGTQIHLRVLSSSQVVLAESDLKPVAVHRIKAEGADVIGLILNASGIGAKDGMDIAERSTLISYAIFQPDWVAPDVSEGEEVQISAAVIGAPLSEPITPVRVKIRPLADWLKEPLVSREEMGKHLNRYHGDESPGRLLSLLRSAAELNLLNAPQVYSFFGFAYQQNIAARNAAVALFPALDQKTQRALLFVLRLAGQDLTSLFPSLPAGSLGALQKVPALTDPRKLPHFEDPVAAESVGRVGVIMDQCWSGWMATGDQSYVRAIVDLLEAGDDFPAFQAWTKARSGAKGLNAKVAKGLTYQIAGWSLGAFQRADPLVSDWLLFWAADPATSPRIQKEILGLAANPVFRRK